MSEPVVVYANVTTLEVGPYDFTISFGTKKNRANPAPDERDADCSVYMSPQHAKILLKLLAGAVEGYEVKHGPIPEVGTITDLAEGK